MRVELTTRVTTGDVDLREVPDASDLDVVWGLDEMRALHSAVGDDASAMAALDAPCNLDPLGVSDFGVGPGLGRCEEAEVVERVNWSRAVSLSTRLYRR